MIFFCSWTDEGCCSEIWFILFEICFGSICTIMTMKSYLLLLQLYSIPLYIFLICERIIQSMEYAVFYSSLRHLKINLEDYFDPHVFILNKNFPRFFFFCLLKNEDKNFQFWRDKKHHWHNNIVASCVPHSFKCYFYDYGTFYYLALLYITHDK